MIRLAQPNDFAEIRLLWEECFPDESGFNDYFFAHVFRLQDTVLLFDAGTLCAMLQMMPYTLRLGAKIVPVTYIYGACTAIQARKKGYMAQLLHWSFAQDAAQHRKASILIPQEPWLFDFYQRYGYQAAFFTKEYTCTPSAQQDTAVRRCSATDIPALQQLYQSVTAEKPLVLQRSTAQWQAQLDMFEALGAGVYALFADEEIQAYAFLWEDAQEVWAQEWMAVSKTAEQHFSSALAAQFPQKTLRYTTLGGQKPLGCIKIYDAYDMNLDGYFNLLYQ